MKRTTSQLLKVAFGLVAFILVLGIAGSFERSEQIISSMSQEAYDVIVEKLGDDASMKAIAREYTEHQEFYDSIY